MTQGHSINQVNIRNLAIGVKAVISICVIALMVMWGVFVCGTPVARAAVISFDPQETTVGTSDPFLIGLTIDSDVPINAIRGVINIPNTFEVVDASDGNSVINLWVERPHLNDARQIVFEGLIPGGFEGYHGKLVTLTVKANKEGSVRLSISPSSRVYMNDEDASAQPIISRPLDLVVIAGRDNIANDIPDTDAPERFVPVIGMLPDGSSGGASTTESRGVWAVSFVTQDKRSGIDRYEVAESPSRISVSDTRKLSRLSWNNAMSPYILADQLRSSYVYVKAIDKQGNIRVERLDPSGPRPWYRTATGYILIALTLFLVLFIALYVLRSRITITRRGHS